MLDAMRVLRPPAAQDWSVGRARGGYLRKLVLPPAEPMRNPAAPFVGGSMDQRASASDASDRSPLRLLTRRLQAILIVDFRSLGIVPGGGWLAILAIVAVIVVFGVLRTGIRDVYTESLPFLITAMLIGYLSRGTGIALVGLFAIVDLIVPIVDPAPYSDVGDSPMVLVGRVISWWLLWLLVVSIPTLQRQTRARLTDDPRRPAAMRLLGAPLGAAAAGALTFLWSNAQPYLIRPVFAGEPQSPAMLPQQMPVQLGVTAGAIALVLGLAYQARIQSPTDFISVLDLNRLHGRAGLVARVVVYSLALIAILGLLTSPLDVVVLVLAFVAAESLAAAVARSGIARTLAGVPLWARLLGGLAATFLVAQVVTSLLQEPALGSEFFPMIVSMAIGIVIFRVLVVEEIAPVELGTPPRPAASSAVVILLFAAAGATTVLLTSPTPAAADNCGGLTDCLNGWWAQVGAAVSAIVAFLWSLITAIFEKTPPLISDLEPLASEEGAGMEFGALQMLQNRVATDVLNDTGDVDEYYRIRGLTPAEFADEARTGKWDRLGRRAPYVGVTGASGG
jgi:hypothetical protein